MRVLRLTRWLLLVAWLPLGGLHATDLPSPEAVADALHEAISAGDEAALSEILDPQVLIFESGGVESSLEEYASHHMQADIAFMAEIEREVLSREVITDGSLSVVTTRSRLHGKYQGRDMNLASNETLVIRSEVREARITHIHWSSTELR